MFGCHCVVCRIRAVQIIQGVALSTKYHPELAHLSWLIGTWVGVGVVGYPSMESDIQVAQELVIAHDGRPFLSHWSRTWQLDSHGERIKPLAVESGFWRPRPNNEAEFLLAHPTGFLESWFGTVTVTGIEEVGDTAIISGARIILELDALVRTTSAKEVTSGQRMYGLVEGGDLGWVYDMQTPNTPMTSHASFRLSRQD